MSTIKVALCDNDLTALNIIDRLLTIYSMQSNDEFQLRYYPTSQALLAAKRDYDILLLDIVLEKGVDGIGIGQRLREQGDSAIFILVASCSDRYKDAYRAHVFRYLEKPLKQGLFFEALNSAAKSIKHSPQKIAISFDHTTSYVNIKDIVMIESYYRTRMLLTTNGRVPTKVSWDNLMSRLPPDMFYAPRKSFYINLLQVRYTSKTKVTMNNGHVVNFTQCSFDGFSRSMYKALAAYT